eukprot:TRINITY_DN22634_c0_g1_i1.p1 TRINITY_DN22634_c0_g1~~TRINITY_DN22634_c0_g1_i1.p1  ORF type:complete len:184 (+),score=48.64 TRINITY_DN22634_c0_g1_i1:64-615(+)
MCIRDRVNPWAVNVREERQLFGFLEKLSIGEEEGVAEKETRAQHFGNAVQEYLNLATNVALGAVKRDREALISKFSNVIEPSALGKRMHAAEDLRHFVERLGCVEDIERAASKEGRGDFALMSYDKRRLFIELIRSALSDRTFEEHKLSITDIISTLEAGIDGVDKIKIALNQYEKRVNSLYC